MTNPQIIILIFEVITSVVLIGLAIIYIVLSIKKFKEISKLKRLEDECEELMKFYDKQSLTEWVPEARNIDKEKAECYRHLIEYIHELKK